MKKIILGLCLSFVVGIAVQAQVNNGGLPLSITNTAAMGSNEFFTKTVYQAPDISVLLLEDAKATRSNPKPYRVGKLIPVDISFPQSGQLITLPNGTRVWRAQVQVAQAPALMFYYSQFKLPSGVKLFLSNGNGKQILGAYTQDNNSDDGLFVTQEIQGDIANIELNIDNGVDINAIKLHIDNAAYLYRSFEYLQKYASSEWNDAYKPTADFAEGASSVCEINAICPQGQNFPEPRKATVRILIPVGGGYVGFCTGTLINNTKGDCTPYVLTASHCEDNNSKVNSTFSQWMFYYNFEVATCSATANAPNNATQTGASFVSRSNFNPNNPALLGDFLLLKLNAKVPVNYGAWFAGWNRATSMPSNSTYINFHHPSGDMKKLAVGNNVNPNEVFNQFSTLGTHWGILFTEGGNEEGSSGSGLFDVNGRLIGDLSGGSSDQGCPRDTNYLGNQALFGKDAVYSKLSRNWEYPEGNGAENAQLKTWLDPTNTGSLTTNHLQNAATCNAPTTGIFNSDIEFNDAVSIYPNPVVGSSFQLKIHLGKISDIEVNLYDVNGAKKANYNLPQIMSGQYTLDVSTLANGVYWVSVSNGENVTAKKVVIRK